MGKLCAVQCFNAKPAEVTSAQWNEFDLEDALWSLPASRTKAGRSHVIHLDFGEAASEFER